MRVDPQRTMDVVQKIIKKLESGVPPKGAPRAVGADDNMQIQALAAGTAGVVILKTWKCEPCGGALCLQGEPCPTCGKELLLG